MGRVATIAGAALLLVPAAAWAQDATVLAVALGPSLLATPIVAQWVRRRWLLARNDTGASWRALAAAGLVEWLLWMAVGYCVAQVVFQESWLALAAATLGIAAIVLVVRAVGKPHRSWRFTLAMFAVFPLVFAVGVLIAIVAGLALS